MNHKKSIAEATLKFVFLHKGNFSFLKKIVPLMSLNKA